MFDLQPPRHIPTLPIASIRPDFNDFRSSPIADIVKEDVANPPKSTCGNGGLWRRSFGDRLVGGHGTYFSSLIVLPIALASFRTSFRGPDGCLPFSVTAAIGPAISPSSTGRALMRPLRPGWSIMELLSAVTKCPALQQVKSQLDRKSCYRRFGHRQPFGLKGFRQQLVEERARRADHPALFQQITKGDFSPTGERVRSRGYHRYPIMKKDFRVEVRQGPRN